MKKIVAALALYTLSFSYSFAVTYNLTFDTDSSGGAIPANAIVGSQYSSWGVSFLANGFSGGYWASNTSLEVGSLATGTLGSGATSAMGNVLHSFPGYLTEDGDPSFRVNLPTGTTSVQADFVGDHDGESFLLAFSSSGTVLASHFASPGFSSVKVLVVSSATPIAYAIIVPGTYNDWVGVDNLRVTVVPEPGSLTALTLCTMLLLWRRTRT